MPDTLVLPDLKSAAQRLAPELATRASEVEAARRLPADLARKMAEAGFFRMVTPKTLGGFESSPAEIVETIEILAEANASAAWCVMIGATMALLSAYLEDETAREIFGPADMITGGVFAPMGKAVVEGDGYSVSGRWQWGSGTANCGWIGGGCTIWDKGELRRLPSGAPEVRMMILPANEVTLIDTWQAMGLKGTGSGDFEVKARFVPHRRSASLVSDRPRAESALYKFPAFGLLALGIASVALGNARGALDTFRALAVSKKSQGSSKTLSERQPIQAAYSQADARWRAARAFLFSEVNRNWAAAQSPGDLSPQMRADLRQACTHMVREGAEICRTLYDLGGGAAVFDSSPLQRQFRDAHAITQHIMTAPATHELFGRMRFGLPTDADMV